MNLEEKEDMCRFVLDVNEEFGTTIVLIEHDMDAVFKLADRLTVMVNGEVLETGTPESIRTSPAVREAYLGEEEALS